MTADRQRAYRMKIEWCQANAVRHMRDALEALRAGDLKKHGFHLDQIAFWRKREKACLAVLNGEQE